MLSSSIIIKWYMYYRPRVENIDKPGNVANNNMQLKYTFEEFNKINECM